MLRESAKECSTDSPISSVDLSDSKDSDETPVQSRHDESEEETTSSYMTSVQHRRKLLDAKLESYK